MDVQNLTPQERVRQYGCDPFEGEHLPCDMYLPTPAEIKVATQEIRKEWTNEQEDQHLGVFKKDAVREDGPVKIHTFIYGGYAVAGRMFDLNERGVAFD